MNQINLDTLRHSCAHILAQAVCELYSGTKLGIGPPIKDGFYYDFEIPQPINEENLKQIEDRMHDIIQKNLAFIREVKTKKEAQEIFKAQPYKLELIQELEDEEVIIYKQGDFVDLCLGPHLNSTGEVKAFKLLSTAGAYWRGDEANPMLTRIYGTAFFSEEELNSYLSKLEEAKIRDHRKFMRQLELFDIYQEAGKGLVFYHQKGTVLRDILCNFLKEEHRKRGYKEVVTPHIAKLELWEKSGHTKYYKDNMFFIESEQEKYVLKPMNCPLHILVYSSCLHSFKELPYRIFELGTVYRKERSGVLHGLLRVRGFTQDDAHIFCTPEQVEEELCSILDFVLFTLGTFGFSEYFINLSTKPKEYAGEESIWEKSTSILKRVLVINSLNFKEAPGEGVFYGPKIDIQLKDALERLWQAATIQLDFILPARFGIYYIDKSGKKATPVMIHRVILGSIERFLATLIEHYKGELPIWLSPIQVRVISVSSSVVDYCKRVEEELKKEGIRVEGDYRNEPFGKKLYDAQVEKIPYILIVGEKEVKKGNVSVRFMRKDMGEKTISSVIEEIKRDLLVRVK